MGKRKQKQDQSRKLIHITGVGSDLPARGFNQHALNNKRSPSKIFFSVPKQKTARGRHCVYHKHIFWSTSAKFKKIYAVINKSQHK